MLGSLKYIKAQKNCHLPPLWFPGAQSQLIEITLHVEIMEIQDEPFWGSVQKWPLGCHTAVPHSADRCHLVGPTALLGAAALRGLGAMGTCTVGAVGEQALGFLDSAQQENNWDTKSEAQSRAECDTAQLGCAFAQCVDTGVVLKLEILSSLLAFFLFTFCSVKIASIQPHFFE